MFDQKIMISRTFYGIKHLKMTIIFEFRNFRQDFWTPWKLLNEISHFTHLVRSVENLLARNQTQSRDKAKFSQETWTETNSTQ